MNQQLQAIQDVRDYLQKTNKPVKESDLYKKTGISKHDLPTLVKNEVIYSWVKLKSKDVVISDRFINPYKWYAEKIMEYLKNNADRVIRVHEISDQLKIDYATVQYCSDSIADVYYSLAPTMADCAICLYNNKCKKDIPAVKCGLFISDYREGKI